MGYPNEYFIEVLASDRPGYLIKSEDLTPLDDEFGFARIEVLSFRKNEVLVGINDTGHRSVERFYVPQDDIFESLDAVSR